MYTPTPITQPRGKKQIQLPQEYLSLQQRLIGSDLHITVYNTDTQEFFVLSEFKYPHESQKILEQGTYVFYIGNDNIKKLETINPKINNYFCTSIAEIEQIINFMLFNKFNEIIF